MLTLVTHATWLVNCYFSNRDSSLMGMNVCDVVPLHDSTQTRKCNEAQGAYICNDWQQDLAGHSCHIHFPYGSGLLPRNLNDWLNAGSELKLTQNTSFSQWRAGSTPSISFVYVEIYKTISTNAVQGYKTCGTFRSGVGFPPLSYSSTFTFKINFTLVSQLSSQARLQQTSF